MAWNLHAIEQTQWWRQHRIDRVGRLNFDFHTGLARAAGEHDTVRRASARRLGHTEDSLFDLELRAAVLGCSGGEGDESSGRLPVVQPRAVATRTRSL